MILYIKIRDLLIADSHFSQAVSTHCATKLDVDEVLKDIQKEATFMYEDHAVRSPVDTTPMSKVGNEDKEGHLNSGRSPSRGKASSSEPATPQGSIVKVYLLA